MAYQPKSMLVTGGAGFIGSNFIRYVLAHEPHTSIINLDKLTYAGSRENLRDFTNARSYHFIQGDINDAQQMRHILQHHHIDTIVHFAAESHVDRSIHSPLAFVETNVLGTATLLDAARYHWLEVDELNEQYCRFHHISTDEVYGSLTTSDPSASEESKYQPRSPYAASKAGSDHLVRAFYDTYQLPITISNCSNNFGPYQHPEKFIPTIILSCLNNKPIPIYGEGKNIRDWLYVEDHCHGIMSIIKFGKIGESYNIGANNEWKNMTLAQYICQRMDKILPRKKPYASLIQHVSDRPGHDFRYSLNAKKIRQELSWQPEVSFETGITKTIDFYVKQFAMA